MNVVILYRKDTEAGKEYPLDSEGRGGLDHVIRIICALESLGHVSELVNVDLDMFEFLRKSNFDLAFNLCDDGFRNNSLLEPHIPAMLDLLRIPYTGSNFFTLASCLDKAHAKKILSFHNIPTANFQVFVTIDERLKSDLNFPLIVKPMHEDASIGIKKESVVSNLAELMVRVKNVLCNYHQPALVEKFIIGREIYVGILGAKDKLEVLPLSEICFDKKLEQTAQICSYEGKWLEDSHEYQTTPVKCPAELNETLEKELIRIAKKSYGLLNCQDYGRVDFRIDENEHPYVLEVNPNPDISEDAGLARMGKAAGISYDQLIEKIISSALAKKHFAKEGQAQAVCSQGVA